ncbi:hypothetical protein C5S32_10185 [ANME-1 cluster archaeon GoMg1]|nr:hypothetical protein [ANME-1 cluster archaeon GoMg1]
MHNPNQNTKGAKIGVVLTDPDGWTASAFLKNRIIDNSISAQAKKIETDAMKIIAR